jgi:RNA 2',3'-cyclic 3'-phosphodiesterase
MIRTFIALEIPQPALDQVSHLIKKGIRSAFYSYRWVPLQNLHITIKFIGDIEENLLEKIVNKLKIDALEFDKMNLEFSKFGFFEKNRKPTIFWVGCNYNALLIKFVEYIEVSLFELGIPKEEKKFKSHLTLLRLKGDENIEPLKILSDMKFEEISFKPVSISIIKSELSSKGAKYFVIKNLVI